MALSSDILYCCGDTSYPCLVGIGRGQLIGLKVAIYLGIHSEKWSDHCLELPATAE